MAESIDQIVLQPVTEFAKLINWSPWVTAVATIVLAVLTYCYVRLTGKILATQSDPCVILTVVPDDDRPTVLQLVARNVGTGLAHDIRFEFSRLLPARAFGLTESEANEVQEMKDGPLIDGIPALGPGECRKIDWGQYGGLMAALGNEPIVATCKFKKDGKEMRLTQCPLEVASFVGTVAVESSAAKMVKELEKLSKSVETLGSGFRTLKVDVVSLPQNRDDSEKT